MRGDDAVVWRVEAYGASRPASEAQLACAAELEAACFPERGGAAAALGELRRTTQLRRAALLLCAPPETDAPLLGFALVTWTVGGGSVAKLAVAAHARRRGVGAALLSGALAELRAAGARAATLHVDAGPDGGAARRLYARFGFAEESRAADYYGRGKDALGLRRPL